MSNTDWQNATKSGKLELGSLQGYTEKAVCIHSIPALSIAVWKDNTLHQAASGTLNIETGVNATTDTLFQIGSITKVMTSCLIMQLVEEGRLNLDSPVQRYLNDFMLADAEAAKRITVRHLLSHTSGIAGDYFPDDGHHSGNLISRYVDRCSQLPVIHPVGQMYSYSNSAFGIAGRLIEVVRGMGWYQAMREYLYQPLNMNHAIADPRDLLRYRAACGHVFDRESNTWVLPEKAYLTLGLAPAGITPAMTAADLITFARAHLNGGLNEQGSPWLPLALVNEMQAEQIRLPSFSQVAQHSAGLGWAMEMQNSSGVKTIGHVGAVRGSLSVLRIIPDQQSAFVIMMNGFKPYALEKVTQELMQCISGVVTREPKLPARNYDVEVMADLVGQYESFDTVIRVTLENQKLYASIIYKIDPLPPQRLLLIDLGGGRFGALTPEGDRRRNMVFVTESNSRIPSYVFNCDRLNRRL